MLGDTRTVAELLEARPADGTPEYEAWRLGAITSERIQREGMTPGNAEVFDLVESMCKAGWDRDHVAASTAIIGLCETRWRYRARTAATLATPTPLRNWWRRLARRPAQQRTVTAFGLWGLFYVLWLVAGLVVVGTDEWVPQWQVGVWFCGFAVLGIVASLRHRKGRAL